jgi:hypothetical protein
MTTSQRWLQHTKKPTAPRLILATGQSFVGDCSEVDHLNFWAVIFSVPG